MVFHPALSYFLTTFPPTDLPSQFFCGPRFCPVSFSKSTNVSRVRGSRRNKRDDVHAVDVNSCRTRGIQRDERIPTRYAVQFFVTTKRYRYARWRVSSINNSRYANTPLTTNDAFSTRFRESLTSRAISEDSSENVELPGDDSVFRTPLDTGALIDHRDLANVHSTGNYFQNRSFFPP